jgi:hypothetical protein
MACREPFQQARMKRHLEERLREGASRQLFE